MNTKPASLPVVTVRPERGETNLERMAPPAAGTYWCLREDFKGRHDDRCTANSMDAGTVLMISAVKFADGEPHAYVFQAHPAWPTEYQVAPVFHADEFFLFWSPAADPEKTRNRELAELMGEMEETKQQMLSAPPDAVPAGMLTFDPSPAVGQPGQALATLDSIQSMTAYAERMQEDAEIRSKWIQKHSTVLSGQGTALARFHQERATAVMARAQAQLDGVRGILKTVENLRIYTGQGVTLTPLRDGDPAPFDAKIVVYQELLSLDEETLCLLDEGGLDHTKVDDLAEALADPALIDRMIPSPRGMVLCRFRTSDKVFAKGNDASAAYVNAAMNAASRQVMLLVRDGQRIWIVDIDGVIDGMKQLLPSTGEQNDHFTHHRGRDSRRITRDDLAYADAQRRQVGMLDQYGKVIIALWGLNDREDLFSGSNIPKWQSWLDPQFQLAFMVLVSLDNMIGVERPSFREWQLRQNAYLAAGAWVAVDLRTAFVQDYIPGAFASQGCFERSSNSTVYNQTYEHELPASYDHVLMERVRTDTRGLYVEVPLRYSGYNSSVSRQSINGKLYVRIPGTAYSGPSSPEGLLVLDRARSSDLHYYLTSRVQRRNYGAYVRLFRQGRAWTAHRDEREAPLRSYLRDAVHAARLDHDADALDDMITDALAIARTSRRDRTIPAPGDTGFKPFVEGALASLHALLSDNTARVAHVDAWAMAHGRTPLRLSLSGKDRWRLYLIPSEEEHDARLGELAHASTADVTFTGSGVEVMVTGREMLRSETGEHVVHDWEWEVPARHDNFSPFMKARAKATQPAGATAWLAKRKSYQLPYSKAIETLDLATTCSAAFPDESPEEIATRARRYMFGGGSGGVRRLCLHAPVGSGLRKNEPQVLVARIDALAYAHRNGDDAVKEFVVKAISDIYRRPETHLDALDKQRFAWSLHGVSLDTLHRSRNNLSELAVYRAVREEECLPPGISASKDKEKTMQVMAVTPLGVELFPWLAFVTRAALK